MQKLNGQTSSCVLHEIDKENSGERSVQAQGILTEIYLTFIGTLAIFKILGDVKLFPDMLQAPSRALASAVGLIQALQDTLEERRGVSCFDDLWKDAVDTAKQCNIAVEAFEKRFPRGTVRLGGYVVEYIIGRHMCKDGDKDKFRNYIFYPILDCVNAEIVRKFSKTNCDMMKVLEALNPKSKSFQLE